MYIVYYLDCPNSVYDPTPPEEESIQVETEEEAKTLVEDLMHMGKGFVGYEHE